MFDAEPLDQEAPQGVFFSRISRDFYAYWQSLARRRARLCQ